MGLKNEDRKYANNLFVHKGHLNLLRLPFSALRISSGPKKRKSLPRNTFEKSRNAKKFFAKLYHKNNLVYLTREFLRNCQWRFAKYLRHLNSRNWLLFAKKKIHANPFRPSLTDIFRTSFGFPSLNFFFPRFESAHKKAEQKTSIIKSANMSDNLIMHVSWHKTQKNFCESHMNEEFWLVPLETKTRYSINIQLGL